MQLQSQFLPIADGTLLPTKGNASNLAKGIVNEVLEGNIDPFQLLAQLEGIKLICEEVRAGIESHVTNELSKYGKEGHKVMDARFEAAEVGVKYDYSGCPKWKEYKAKEDEAAKERKEREALLKALTKPMAETDMESGETIEVLPPVKSSKSSFKISLAK